MTTTTTTATDSPPSAPTRKSRQLIAVLLGVPVIIVTLLSVIVGPIVNSGPSDLPVAIAGPPPATTAISNNLNTARPGAFEVTTFDSAEAATDAVKNREAVGAITVTQDGVTVVKASGAGMPYTAVLDGVAAQLQQSGQKVTVTDVAPLPDTDPSGMSLNALALPLTMGAIIPGVLLTLIVRGHPLRRMAIATGIAVIAGFGAATVMQYGFGTIEGNFWLTGLAISAGVLAGSSLTVGLGAFFGQPGVGLGALLMLFVANPLSGMATGPQWLPSPWGDVGQLLPVGAAGTAIRSAAYFDGAGAGAAWVVLSVWIAVGASLAALGVARHLRSTD